jgi:hypothetical protein
MKQITDELFEVVVSLRFSLSYKREGIRESSFVREFNDSFLRESEGSSTVECSAVEC